MTRFGNSTSGRRRAASASGKLKVGLDREGDLRRIGIMREALATSGKEPILLIDSNEYWSPKQAIQHIRYFERHYELFWAEEPARRWDYAGLRKVSDSVNAAVATGENLDDAADFRALIAHRSADILQIGVGTGGITGAMRVALMADGFDLPVSVMNCPGDFMAHFAAVLPNHIWMEVVDPGGKSSSSMTAGVEDGYIILAIRRATGFSSTWKRWSGIGLRSGRQWRRRVPGAGGVAGACMWLGMGAGGSGGGVAGGFNLQVAAAQ